VRHDFRFSLFEAPTLVRDLFGFMLNQSVVTAPAVRS